MNPTPLVSILINNYNYGRYVAKSIDSCLMQSYPECEIIVFDDQSNDNSIEVLSRYKNRIQLIRGCGKKSKHNSFNQANAINKAFIKSRGEIICLLDSDDTFLPAKVERVAKNFDSNPDIVLVQHPFFEIDEMDSFTKTIRPKLKNVHIKEYIFRSYNLAGLFSQTSGLSFRRSYLEKILPIIEDDYPLIWPDVRLTRQSIFYGMVDTIWDPLGCYRVHDRNDSLKLDNKEYLKEFLHELYNYFNLISTDCHHPKIELSKSIANPDFSPLGFYFHALISRREPPKVKIDLFLSLLKKQFHARSKKSVG